MPLPRARKNLCLTNIIKFDTISKNLFVPDKCVDRANTLRHGASESCWLLKNSAQSRYVNSPLSSQLKVAAGFRYSPTSRRDRVSRRYNGTAFIACD